MSLRGISENKLKAFSIGAMGKRTLTKKEQEEQRKREEEEAVGKVYQEFVDTFNQSTTAKVNKTWVKAGTFDAGSRKEDFSEKGKLYKPAAASRFSDIAAESPREKFQPVQRSDGRRPEKPGKKKQHDKKKSNLELFKEELKARQEERAERHRVKDMIRSYDGAEPRSASGDSFGSIDKYTGSHDTGDPNTTNLYLANLSPRLTEQQLMELFGKFGPLASIKIMWPRTEDEKSRGKNCGFVAYMSRADGERALNTLLAKDIDGFEMRMGWGKPVPIPLHPIYIPPSLLKYTLPPPPSGLPFNCQPDNKADLDKFSLGPAGQIRPKSADPTDVDRFNRTLFRSTIKVVCPTDRTQLCLINRMVEFVIREGPMFEAMIMNREINNKNFAFLFDNQSPEHVYYRWKLFSLLQGDSKDHWSTQEFRMFKGGSLWKPPPMNLYTSGMPEEILEDKPEQQTADRDEPRSRPSTRRGLSESQRDRFEDMLRGLLPDRNPIAETMVWCIEHAEAGEEIVECIAESLSILQTPIIKKIARLYLISDILHNCSIKGVPNVSYFRKGFQAKLPDVFEDLSECYKSIESRVKAEAFKQRVMLCFRAWEDWALYPQDFLIRLQNIFLGLVGEASPVADPERAETPTVPEPDVDGKSMSEDEDVDGVPLDGAALLKSAKDRLKQSSKADSDSDLDGAPLDTSRSRPLPAGFVPSKWETVDPDEVQAQAVTSKWDIFEEEERKKKITDPDDDDDLDGIPLQDDNDIDIRISEDRRARLREIELKVMCYQDQIESGQVPMKSGWTLSDQVEHFRKKLLKKASKGESTPASSRVVESDEDDRSRSSSKKKRRRRRSSSSSRSRSPPPRSKSRKTRRSSSSSPERSSRRRSSPKRRRSRTPPSTKKHKKKKH